MKFRSVDQLNRDIATWSESFPEDIDLIVGIPRSGLLAATLLALHLHLPLADLDGLLAGRTLGVGKRMEEAAAADVIDRARRILVVDDSANRGGAIRAAKDKVDAAPHLRDKVLWAAPYVTPSTTGLLDHWFEVVAQPRAFEWNVLHHSGLVDAGMSVEGVLCGDGAMTSTVQLHTAPPRLVPASAVGWLVSTRPERDRAALEAWLDRHGIRYGELVMRPDGPPGDPRIQGARLKADVYRRTRAWLFIESDQDEAVRIADMSHRPVYCTTLRLMVYPGVPVGAPARGRDTAAWRAAETLRMHRKRVGHWRDRIRRLR